MFPAKETFSYVFFKELKTLSYFLRPLYTNSVLQVKENLKETDLFKTRTWNKLSLDEDEELARSYVPNSKKCILKCRNQKLNFYKGQAYSKFKEVPLASSGWKHKKSREDYFHINPIFENPAFSEETTFNDLGISTELLEILSDDFGIEEPTFIQNNGIPVIAEGKNTLLAAETGCGKTLAFLLPLIQQILHWKKLITKNRFNAPLGVILSPSRELSTQTAKVVKIFEQKLPFKSKIILGGSSRKKMLNPDFEEIDLLITTPGIISKLSTVGIYTFQHVHHVVMDEADTLLDDSFEEKIQTLLKRFNFVYQTNPIASEELPVGAQLTLVSATMPTRLPDILGSFIDVESLQRVESPHLHRAIMHIPQKFIRLGASQKPVMLLKIAKSHFKERKPLMIFSNDGKTCDWISLFLNENGVVCSRFNKLVHRYERMENFDRFQNGEVNIISCTDLGSRGINTARVEHVLNYDFPNFMADYIHRCGRAGRVGSLNKSCITNFVCHPIEVEQVQKIEYSIRKDENLPNVNGNISRVIQFRAERHLNADIRRK